MPLYYIIKTPSNLIKVDLLPDCYPAARKRKAVDSG